MYKKIVAATLILLASSTAFAIQPDKEGFYRTGHGVRIKEVAFFEAKVYAIEHYMRALPEARSRTAMIEAEVDKKFAWRMLRDVEQEKIIDALRTGYTLNGYKDGAKISAALAAFSGDLAEGSKVLIRYDVASQTTTIQVSGGKTVSVAGSDFMRATWSLWFGKIDQSALSDALLSDLPSTGARG